MEKKFNPEKLNKLNNPDRLKMIPPEYIWEKLNIPECRTIIDIGAGTGLFSKAFYKMMDKGTVYSADISPVMVDWMKENIPEEYNSVIPLLMDESVIPLGDGIADLVIMITLHHELEDSAALLEEARRTLKKGGKICIIDWKKKDMTSGPPVEIRFSSGEIETQLESADFTEIQIDDTLDLFSFLQAVK